MGYHRNFEAEVDRDSLTRQHVDVLSCEKTHPVFKSLWHEC